VIHDTRVPDPDLSIVVGETPVAPRVGAWPGVVVFLSRAGRAIQIGAAGSCRRFVSTRLGEDPDAPGGRAVLRADTARVLVYRTGSAFESDWLTLTLARSLDTALHATLAGRLRPPALVLDPESGTWSARELDEDARLDPPLRVIAPIRTLEGAAALGEAIDERFELCRYPAELARAPRGSACAYKEMGKCPAPCDGSEPMSEYLARFALAADTLGAGVGAWIRAERAAMDDASSSMDFERAASHKRTLDALAALPEDVRTHARDLLGRRFAVVSRAVRPRWCRVWSLGARGLAPVLSIDASAHRGVLDRAIETLRARSGFDPGGAAASALEEFGLAMRALHPKRRGGRAARTSVLCVDAMTPRTLADALSRCAAAGGGGENRGDDGDGDGDGEDPLSYNSA